jgi:hypothetical protein
MCKQDTPSLAIPGTNTLNSAFDGSGADLQAWLTYVVRDGAPSGQTLINSAGSTFHGGGGFTFDWRHTPLYTSGNDRRAFALGALAPFVNDNGHVDIVRVCEHCIGNEPVDYTGAGGGGVVPLGTADVRLSQKSDWILELAFAADCRDTAAGPEPKVNVWWSQKLWSKLAEMPEYRTGTAPEAMGKRFCSSVSQGQLDPQKCPFNVVGKMEDLCTIDENRMVRCAGAGTLASAPQSTTYTFIHQSSVQTAY